MTSYAYTRNYVVSITIFNTSKFRTVHTQMIQRHDSGEGKMWEGHTVIEADASGTASFMSDSDVRPVTVSDKPWGVVRRSHAWRRGSLGTWR